MAAASDSAWRSRIDSSYSRRDGDDSIMFRTGAAPGAAQWRTRAWISRRSTGISGSSAARPATARTSPCSKP